MKYLAAKAEHERLAGDLRAVEERLEACKVHASQQTELLQRKTREVEEMRTEKAVDDREREVRLGQLANQAKV